MVIIKRSGVEAPFDINKIVEAIKKANQEVSSDDALELQQIYNIANKVANSCRKYNRPIPVDMIQEFVETELINTKKAEIAKHYIRYRYQRDINRKKNTTDDQIFSTVDLKNQEVKEENSNKNPTIISTQRDYVAGLTSRDMTERYLLPKEITEAHQKGIIHFHDSDYFIHHIHNCDLINLEDMLQNGTVINGVKIEKPRSFLTACTIMTQIMAIVASSQYGGQSMSLAHIAPFVEVSRQKIRKEVENEYTIAHNKIYGGELIGFSDKANEIIDTIVEKRVKEEIKKGVQTIQYQVLTLNSSNGQTPFVTLGMYLGETEDEHTKNDLALIIEEVLVQRIQGIKNEVGVWVTPTFPKLVYVLEKDNVCPGSKYYYLTELAAKCTAKRMVPDYVSEKIMKANKINARGEGDCYPPMGERKLWPILNCVNPARGCEQIAC